MATEQGEYLRVLLFARHSPPATVFVLAIGIRADSGVSEYLCVFLAIRHCLFPPLLTFNFEL